MFTLPSLWNIVVSTIVFIPAAWYFRSYLEAHGLPKGLARGMLVFILAYAVSWASGEFVDWLHVKIEGPQAEQKLDLGMQAKQMLVLSR